MSLTTRSKKRPPNGHMTRWREHAVVLLANLTLLGGFASRLHDPREGAVLIEPPPTLTPAPTPTAMVLRVYVSGAVTRPGVVTLPAGARVADALEGAGSFSSAAAPDHINLAAPLGDGQQIHVPSRDEVDGRYPDGLVPGGVSRAPDAAAAASGRGGGAGSIGGSGAGGGVAADGRVDINTADAAALQLLPGVGPALAARIAGHRDTNGPFESVDTLVEVAGIGPKTLERMRDLVIVR